MGKMRVAAAAPAAVLRKRRREGFRLAVRAMVCMARDSFVREVLFGVGPLWRRAGAVVQRRGRKLGSFCAGGFGCRGLQAVAWRCTRLRAVGSSCAGAGRFTAEGQRAWRG